ncbi:MAG: SIP domain-containing protein [Acidimicrobiia bacterium]|nr:SIP domain-containing protein [Acidimicrobiia bacterium]
MARVSALITSARLPLLHALVWGSCGVGIEVCSPEAIGGRLADTAASAERCVLRDGTPPGTARSVYVSAECIEPGTTFWAAGEAAAMQRIRRHFFNDRGIDRSDTMIRCY